MRITNLLCASALALGALLLVVPAAAGGGGTTGSSGGSGAGPGGGPGGGPGDVDALQGHAHGRFRRPSPGAAGAVEPGRFRARLRLNGHTRFRMFGAVLPGDAPGGGDLHGVLSLATPFGPLPVGQVHGHWQRTAPHGGTYQAVFVAPPGAANPDPTPFGGSQGTWQDDPTSPAPGGPLHGHWVVQLP